VEFPGLESVTPRVSVLENVGDGGDDCLSAFLLRGLDGSLKGDELVVSSVVDFPASLEDVFRGVCGGC
jgi:hypothetical protein